MEEICRIKADFSCPKGYICMENSYQNICKSRNSRLAYYLYCLEPGTDCPFRVTRDKEHFCSCPLRDHFKRKLDL